MSKEKKDHQGSKKENDAPEIVLDSDSFDQARLAGLTQSHKSISVHKISQLFLKKNTSCLNISAPPKVEKIKPKKAKISKADKEKRRAKLRQMHADEIKRRERESKDKLQKDLLNRYWAFKRQVGMDNGLFDPNNPNEIDQTTNMDKIIRFHKKSLALNFQNTSVQRFACPRPLILEPLTSNEAPLGFHQSRSQQKIKKLRPMTADARSRFLKDKTYSVNDLEGPMQNTWIRRGFEENEDEVRNLWAGPKHLATLLSRRAEKKQAQIKFLKRKASGKMFRRGNTHNTENTLYNRSSYTMENDGLNEQSFRTNQGNRNNSKSSKKGSLKRRNSSRSRKNRHRLKKFRFQQNNAYAPLKLRNPKNLRLKPKKKKK